jgi:fatty acid desaturase
LTNADQVPQAPASAPTGDRARRERARRRVAAIKGFYIHLFVFVLVVAGLVVINWLTGGPWWAIGVFLVWGIGVLAHGLVAMGRIPSALASWEERKIKQLMDEDRR